MTRAAPWRYRIERAVRRGMRWAGEWLLALAGPLPTACLVLRLDDGSRSGKLVRLLNVRKSEPVGEHLEVTDLYGRRELFRLDRLLSARHRDTVPVRDFLAGAVEVA